MSCVLCRHLYAHSAQSHQMSTRTRHMLRQSWIMKNHLIVSKRRTVLLTAYIESEEYPFNVYATNSLQHHFRRLRLQCLRRAMCTPAHSRGAVARRRQFERAFKAVLQRTEAVDKSTHKGLSSHEDAPAKLPSVCKGRHSSSKCTLA